MQIKTPNASLRGAESVNPGTSSQTRSVLDTTVGDRNNGRQKRQRLDDLKTSTFIEDRAIENKPTLSTSTGSVSTRKSVSPPPLRRAADTLSKAFPSTTGLAKPAPVTKLKTAIIQADSKPETLNPRLLKQAPASHDIRYRLVKALHEQFVRLNDKLSHDANSEEQALVLSDQRLIKMALDEEERAAVGKPSIYSNIIKNKILAYKRMNAKDWKSERMKELTVENPPVAPFETQAAKPLISEPPKSVESGLSLEEELLLLPRLQTTLDGLTQHGYVTKVPSEEAITQAKEGLEAAKGWEICDRCKSRFQVFPGRREEDGALTSGGSCTYHWGKPYYSDKVPGEPRGKRTRKYRCCGQAIGDSTGCTCADCHVFKISETKRLAAILNFEETPRNERGSKLPICIDGEMGFTVYGLELIRLTATAWPSGDELFDVLVRPLGEVLDLNSRFSGVWPHHMAEAVPYDEDPGIHVCPNILYSFAYQSYTEANKDTKTTAKLRIVSSPATARALLFQHLSPQTPLIGHGLENDLNAVRLIHPMVIDTVLLFPHKAGLPYRNGLKTLMQQHLGKQIQAMKVVDGKMEGHDSKEDARAAGELVKLALKNMWLRMQAAGWVLKDGDFIAPSPKSFAPKGPLSVDLLERPYLDDRQAKGVEGDVELGKQGVKRSAAEISTDDKEGEIDDS